MLDDLSLQVQSIYDQTGKNKVNFSKCTCPNPNPEVTILEMLPAALELSTGQNLEEVLKLLHRYPPRCLFFHDGKCQQPGNRPSPCLFPEGMEEELQKLRLKLNEISPLWSENKFSINKSLLIALEKILILSGNNGRSPGAS
jgi:hypothetical protein